MCTTQYTLQHTVRENCQDSHTDNDVQEKCGLTHGMLRAVLDGKTCAASTSREREREKTRAHVRILYLYYRRYSFPVHTSYFFTLILSLHLYISVGGRTLRWVNAE